MEGSYVKTDLKNWKYSEDSRYWIERMNLIMCSAPDMRGWNAGGKGSLMVRVTLSSGVPGCCILSYMYACCGKTCEVACWSGNWKVVVMQCCRPYAGKVKNCMLKSWLLPLPSVTKWDCLWLVWREMSSEVLEHVIAGITIMPSWIQQVITGDTASHVCWSVATKDSLEPVLWPFDW